MQSDDGFLYALDGNTGTQVWKVATPGGGVSSPAVANGVVYVGTLNGRLCAFSAANGTKLWQALAGAVVNPSPAVVDGVLYSASADHKVYAYAINGGDTPVYKRPPYPRPTRRSTPISHSGRTDTDASRSSFLCGRL